MSVLHDGNIVGSTWNTGFFMKDNVKTVRKNADIYLKEFDRTPA